MKILFNSVGGKQYGGNIYERTVKKVASHYFQVEYLCVSSEDNNLSLYKKILQMLWNLWKSHRRTDYEVIIKDLDSCLFLNRKPVKTIAVVHHIDYSFAPALIKFASLFFTSIILKNLRKADAIVVVSKYWENYFKERGYKNVFLIYNGFNLDDFNFSSEEIEEFKKEYQLTGKPIVYLGNCQKAKGVLESYNALKDLDVHLITSGEPTFKIPARNLEISHKEYLKLLKASDIALTMSKFKEGWCRVAHEAMLLKTPVIGSGKGGMKELLEGGEQIICEDFNNLKNEVLSLLDNPIKQKELGENGYNFAKDFTLERFENDWLRLFNKLI